MKFYTGFALFAMLLVEEVVCTSMSKCSANERMTAAGSEDQTILLDGKLALGANEIEQITLDECCAACDTWVGSKPCAGYIYNTSSQQCTLKTELGTLTSDPTSDLIIGYPAQQNYALTYTDQYPNGFSASQTFESVDVSECSFNCLLDSACTAFKHTPNNGQCQTGSVQSGVPSGLTTEAGASFYQIEYNAQESTSSAITPILIIGGYGPGGLTEKIYQFIPETGVITEVGNLMQPLMAFGAHMYGNKLVTVGGLNQYPTGYVGKWFISTSEATPFSFSEPNSPIFTAFACTGIAGGMLYNAMGATAYGRTNAVEKIDLDTNTLITVGNIPLNTVIPGATGLSNDACVWQGSTLYSIGGITSSAAITNAFWSYDVLTQTVTPSRSYPLSVREASAVWYQGKIVVCGGADMSSQGSRACYAFNQTTAQWTPLGAMVEPRYGHKLVNWGDDKILAIGGNVGGSTMLDSIEVYDGTTWTISGALLKTPMSAMQVINLKNPN